MCIHDRLDRRVLVKFGAGLAGASLLPSRAFGQDQTGAEGEPHFFLMLNFQGSFDSSYLFDARPKDMTAAGKIQNYIGEDPGVWTGANGVSTRSTKLVAPLKDFQQYFSVLNGVQMAVTFDGHDQNSNFLVAGNPFGGAAFFADLNHDLRPTPLDFLQVGNHPGIAVANGAAGVTLEADNAAKLSATVAKTFNLGAEPPVMDFIRSRLAANSGGAGAFSAGTRRMSAGSAQANGLAATLASMQFPTDDGDDPLKKALGVVGQYFLRGATRSAFITLPMQGELDTHGPTLAASQPTTYAKVVDDITTLFKTLKETIFDAATGKTLLDVTTVMVASEFGRTMYQRGLSIDKTGTDHNPLSNEILLGGKGVKGGLVVGASDLQTVAADGNLEAFSGAHKRFDDDGMKTMGKPFDFDRLAAVDDLPADYDPAHYLTVASVINTVYKSFGIAATHYWTLGRNLPTAKTLDGLLA